MENTIKLEKLTQKVARDFGSFELHKEIYELSAKMKRSKLRVPLSVLTYAIKNIIHPTFIHAQIPDALELLACVERVRQSTVQETLYALSLNNEHAQKDAHVRLLGDDDSERLNRIASEKDALKIRHSYVTITCQLCFLHIRNLWTSAQWVSIKQTMDAYFPDPDNAANWKSKRASWHDGISEVELEKFLRYRTKCRRFIGSVGQWEEKNADRFNELGIEPSEAYAIPELYQDCQKALGVHAGPSDENVLKDLEQYLADVESMHEEIITMFQDD
ncbi:hypothetical protein PUNSTDRAFT_137194 [Punctularia strigosozonata HHB-11173 SS5]|uniref:uncharacterized protein n=1 Tax=Punctularia strigosozonata (strain HHB-11173) TaxID=741275 RepID=UPI0004416393|nr:uncharacterized protein PUNSTDRAFT_137194 [Punctularia strigosozonata HHB-11173 SS5]EIN05701.1 hypothetical protein PUNSTDRAFT_137194 [Punctularia strigosozonata HHB-11173 SS5]